jgi:hypothetical protein
VRKIPPPQRTPITAPSPMEISPMSPTTPSPMSISS